MKAKAAEEVGIKFHHVSLPAASTVEDVIATVKRLNDDTKISGILVQLPLGEHVTPEGERLVTEAVSPEKDIDGYVELPEFHIRVLILLDSTHITSATYLHALPCPCLRLALLRP
jgi:5,10-methylene-tetrahydrofolate dehydrogenase/methenyl tetrahydrofolate cyclohydrolase